MPSVDESVEFDQRAVHSTQLPGADFEPVKESAAVEKSIIESIFKFIFAGFGLRWLLGYLPIKLGSWGRPSAPVFFGIVGILGLFVAMVYASISESQGHSIM